MSEGLYELGSYRTGIGEVNVRDLGFATSSESEGNARYIRNILTIYMYIYLKL